MTSEHQAWLRERRCKRKRVFASWDDAEAECLLVAKEGKRGDDANPPTPYRCDQPGDAHYHIGHLRFRRRPVLVIDEGEPLPNRAKRGTRVFVRTQP